MQHVSFDYWMVKLNKESGDAKFMKWVGRYPYKLWKMQDFGLWDLAPFLCIVAASNAGRCDLTSAHTCFF